jgi:aldose 1-epimerase
MAIALESGDARLLIDPSSGGAIARYTWRNRNVLRAAPPNANGPLAMACFPLVPFANRIAHGIFRWDDRTIVLRRNFGEHAIHGHGWESAWTVTATARAGLTLAFEHHAGDWPWSYRAEQAFALADGVLHMSLSVTNRDKSSMPVSLGFHPYFPKVRETHLATQVGSVWLSDETQIPTVKAEASRFLDLAHGAALADAPFVDHCHGGWQGTATIGQPGLRVTLRADAPLLHVFVPPGADYFCAEPVTAMPDAVNRSEPAAETGLRALAPGATFSLAMTLTPQEA